MSRTEEQEFGIYFHIRDHGQLRGWKLMSILPSIKEDPSIGIN